MGFVFITLSPQIDDDIIICFFLSISSQLYDRFIVSGVGEMEYDSFKFGKLCDFKWMDAALLNFFFHMNEVGPAFINFN